MKKNELRKDRTYIIVDSPCDLWTNGNRKMDRVCPVGLSLFTERKSLKFASMGDEQSYVRSEINGRLLCLLPFSNRHHGWTNMVAM